MLVTVAARFVAPPWVTVAGLAAALLMVTAREAGGVVTPGMAGVVAPGTAVVVALGAGDGNAGGVVVAGALVTVGGIAVSGYAPLA